jgi:DNA-binding IclR family transcriptional regulator
VDDGRVRAVERAVGILKVMADSKPSLSLEAISVLSGLPKSTTHRILATLSQDGFVESAGHPGTYRLGLTLMEIGNAAIRQRMPMEDVHKILVDLRDQIGEATGMSTLNGETVIVIDRVNSVHPLSYSVGIGSILPAVCTSAGKVLLAGLSGGELDAILNNGPLARCTERTISSIEELRQHLSIVRRDGYAIDDEELAEGLRCLSVPIRDASGAVRYSVGILCAAARVSPQQLFQFLPAVRGAAESIRRHVSINEDWEIQGG